MRRLHAVSLGLAVGLVIVATATAAAWAALKANGAVVRAPSGWALVEPAEPGAVVDPRTVLVAGTDGTVARKSECQVAAYRVPADGAVVVVLRWSGKAADGVDTDRSTLADMKLRRPYFECFDGRGASAQVALRGRAYQVNLLVGDRATTKTVQNALAVARSLDVAR
jgi:hypothetical protein